MMEIGSIVRAASLAAMLLPFSGVVSLGATAVAQAPAAAPARQIGTVKAISGSSLTLATDGGSQVTATVADGARILQLAPGSTDLKSATQITLGDVAVGDRVLITGKSEDDGSFSATRVVLMKSTDIAQKNETEKQDWQRRGAGGIVTAVSGSTLTVSSGARKIQVETAATTKFRRYSGDSVKFEDAKPGTLAQVQVGDQLRVRGNKSDDGSTIQAEEIVSGSFKNLSGTIATINAAGGTLTLKDLTTKKMMTVSVTANSDVRKLPPEIAARFAARQRGEGAAAGAAGPNGGAGRPQGAGVPAAGAAAAAGGPPRGAGMGGPGGGMGGPGRSAGGDLSQMLSRLPTETLSDLKVGDAVMIVASETAPGSDKVTAVTMLSGVEPILAATPSGTPAMTLSPWSVGGAAPEGGGGQ
jgi:co-chaperonin GroES (HSP10)